MMGNDYLIKLQPLSLSNDTIRRIIKDMAYDILSQVVDEIKSCPSGISAYNYTSQQMSCI
jgi:hypothetical protein